MKGSMTIEAAYVIPLSFAVIGVICILGLFQYNRVVLTLTGQECILQIMDERDLEEQGMKVKLLELASCQAEKRTFGLTEVTEEVQMAGGQIVLIYRAKQSVFIDLPLEVKIFYRRVFPEELLRIKEYISEAGDAGLG